MVYDKKGGTIIKMPEFYPQTYNQKFQTGNAPPKNWMVLDRASRKLYYNHHYTPLSHLHDGHGTYAKIMRSPEGTRLILAARATKPYRSHISLHESTVDYALEKRVPIILAWQRGASLEWNLLRAADIITGTTEKNQRRGATMLNFPAELCYPFNPAESLREQITLIWKDSLWQTKL
jgi:hypothetical protein